MSTATSSIDHPVSRESARGNAPIVLIVVLLSAPLLAVPDTGAWHGIRPLLIQAVAFGSLAFMLARVRWSLEGLRTFLTTGPNLALVLFVGWAALSFAITAPVGGRGRAIALAELMRLASGAAIYFAVVYRCKSRDHLKLAVLLLLVGGVLASAAGMLSAGISKSGGVTGAYGNRQLLAAFLVLLLPVAVVFARKGEMFSRPLFATTAALRSLLATLATVMLVATLLLTKNRSSWLGSVVGLLLVTMLLLGTRKPKEATTRKRHLIASAVVALASVALFFPLLGTESGVLERAKTLIAPTHDHSFQQRLQLWSISEKMIRDQPLMGVGVGSFPMKAGKYSAAMANREDEQTVLVSGIRTMGVPSAAQVEMQGASMSSLPHNEYLQLTAELGLVGLVLYLAVLVGFFYRGIRSLPYLATIDRTRKLMLIAAMGAIAAQCVDAFGNPGWRFGDVSPLLWLVLGIGMAATRTSDQHSVAEAEDRFKAPRSLRYGSVRFGSQAMRTLLSFALIVFLFFGTVSGQRGLLIEDYPLRPLTPAQKKALAKMARKSFWDAMSALRKGPFLCLLLLPVPGGYPVCLTAFTSLGAYHIYVGFRALRLASDPPDPGFTIVAQPIIPVVSPLSDDSGVNQAVIDTLNELAHNEAQTVGYAEALLHSMERSQGAAEAGNTFWEKQQLDAAVVYQGKLAAALAEQPPLRVNLVNALQTAGFPSTEVTQADYISFQQDVAQNGLPNSLKQALVQLGADSTTLEGIRQSVIEQDLDESADTFPAELVNPELINAIQEAAEALSQELPAINADLSITKTASPGPVVTGSNITYTLKVTNNGPDTGIGMTVNDNLPPDTAFKSCSTTGGGSCGGSNNNSVVTFPSLAAGASETVTIVATLNCPVVSGTVISNTATVSSLSPDSNLPNNSATATFSASNPPGSLSINDVSITEGDASAKTLTFTVTLSAGSNLTATVDFATANGTATAPSDYLATNGTLTFNPGDLTKTIVVTINGDQTFESDETFTVNLSNVVNAATCDTQGIGTILNDDARGGIFSFSQANYFIPESGGSATITVNRSGDISAAATVDYATPDDSNAATVVQCSTVNGLASPRCDFTTASGTLRFAAGESSKTFMVLISQDNYVEGLETLPLTLLNLTGGAVLGMPSMATLAITDDAIEPPTNPVDDSSNFVRQHYHDFLNREPDADGFAFWTSQIDNCAPKPQCTEVVRVNVSASFFLSIEFQETGFLIDRIYKASYGDSTGISTLGGAHQLSVPNVHFSEILPDTQRIGQGVVVGVGNWQQQLADNKVAFTTEFVQRSLFTTAYSTTLTPAQFVEALFLKTGVTPSTGERQAAINEFGGALTTGEVAARARALRRVAENATFTAQEFNRAFVLMEYFGYLRRNPNAAPDPDYTGYDFWLTKLNNFNGNYIDAEMVKAFLLSAEYRSRFGT